MKLMRFAVLALSLAVAACVTTPTGVTTPGSNPTIPSSPLALGDWRNANAQATLAQFEGEVSQRYGAGLAVSAVVADMRGAEFACAAPTRSDRGEPPAQVCRRTITASGCTHTWQVHVYDQNNDARVARARGLYDRRCGSDGLLGGPG